MSNQGMYGFEDDKSKGGPVLNFGLNSNAASLTRFQYEPNGGKDGAAMAVLDVVFNIEGKDVSYKMFPVTKAFDNGNEIVDPAHPKFQEAVKEFNASVIHIMKAFVTVETLRTALSTPINSFEQYCNVCANLLPPNFKDIKLDLFAQWQWQMTNENTRTFVNLPRNVKHGKWICKHIAPAGEKWKESKVNGLKFIDDNGSVHPFTRSKWFMESNFAKEQKEDNDVDINSIPESESATDGNTANWN